MSFRTAAVAITAALCVPSWAQELQPVSPGSAAVGTCYSDCAGRYNQGVRASNASEERLLALQLAVLSLPGEDKELAESMARRSDRTRCLLHQLTYNDMSACESGCKGVEMEYGQAVSGAANVFVAIKNAAREYRDKACAGFMSEGDVLP